MANMNTLFSTGQRKDKSKADQIKENNMYSGGGMAYEVEDSKNSAFDDVVRQAQSQSAQGGGAQQSGDKPEVNIILWSNGFQVGEDGEFRNMTDPANQRFVEELKQGVVPTELRQKYPKGAAVGLEDRRSREYRPPTPPKYVSFSGQGTSMGGAQAQGGSVDLSATGGKPVVDTNKPVTQIQFRFHNGQRAALDVNHDHTVADLHNYITFVAPVDGNYQLVSGFPPKPLNDPSATIEGAGLLKAAITQKLC